MLLAPGVPGVLVFSIAVAEGSFWEGIWSAKLVLIISYGAAAVIGTPIHLMLRHYHKTSFTAYLVAGVASSAAPIIALIVIPMLASGTEQPASSLYPIAGAMIAASALVAAAFWMIARPDAAAPNASQ
jgi:hypothetical protein